MSILPQARENVRALVGAAALGSTVGLAIGGAYLAGGLARATVVHAQMQRLAGAASGGFSDTALASSASGQDKAVLAIAQAHDPLAHAPVNQGFAAAADADLKDRQVAALVDRLEARRAARDASPAPRIAQTLPVAAETPAPVVMKAALIAPKAKLSGAEPFHLRGALDQSRDLECLTQAVYYEARGESNAGQHAVAQVILNRVRHPAFPKSICGVVFQGAKTGGCQFSFACDGQSHHPLENAAWKRSEKVAAEAMDGQVMSEVGDATHFHAVRIAGPISGLMKVAQIGAHVFYRFGGRAGAPSMFRREAEPSGIEQAHPIFASLALSPGVSAPNAGKLIESAQAAVHHAAETLENAAKLGSSESKTKTSVPPAAPTSATPTVIETAKADDQKPAA